jgi:hypothetical protein
MLPHVLNKVCRLLPVWHLFGNGEASLDRGGVYHNIFAEEPPAFGLSWVRTLHRSHRDSEARLSMADWLLFQTGATALEGCCNRVLLVTLKLSGPLIDGWNSQPLLLFFLHFQKEKNDWKYFRENAAKFLWITTGGVEVQQPRGIGRGHLLAVHTAKYIISRLLCIQRTIFFH